MMQIGWILTLLFVFLVAGFYVNQGQNTLTFYEELETTLPSHLVWDLLVEGFTNSVESPIWPHELERVESQGVYEGGRAQATYRIPLFGDSSHTYVFSQVQKGSSFRYEPLPDHPLQGGGEIQVESQGQNTLIIWQGKYTYKGISPAALFFRFYFRPRFFPALQMNLKELESAHFLDP